MAKDKTKLIQELMMRRDKIRNISIAAHIDHGKTTMTDNLVAGAGMLSENLAGKALWMDFDEQEQERGITIYSANVSMIHEYDGEDYLVNLIDTPGHVDFGGDVTRAMRAVDGTVILVCAVEGVMPQTETVVRQALHERVKPVLFINKVDRLIRELKLTPEQMQERFQNIIKEVNKLIMKYVEKEFAEKWLVSVENGSVAFGSAYRNWAISFPYMKKKGITFKDIIEYAGTERDKELAKKAPLHEVILDMVIHHLPSPIEAQKYRIEKIWTGSKDDSIYKDMVECNSNGKLAAVVTKVVPDPHAGMIATARIFSGTLKKGQFVHLVGKGINKRIQQVLLYKGAQHIQMDEVPAGNIVGIIGIPDVFSGETICEADNPIKPFEAIKHIFEPVVTKSIEPKDPRDLQKVINFLRQVNREDPTLKITINQETGEYLVSGLGELHIDAKVERPLKEKLGVEAKTSPPIVVYRETVRTASPVIEGKSSNKHNRFYIMVEPLEQEVYQAILEDKIPQGVVKEKELWKKFAEYGMPKEDAKGVKEVYDRNVFVDATKGIQYLNETMELILEAFRQICREGPLAKEPVSGIKVKLVDAKLHEDAIHRGPAQVIPAVKYAIGDAIQQAKPTLLEPVQIIRIDTTEETMGNVINLVQNKRGQVLDMKTEQGAAIIQAKLPVAEMFGFEAALKSATGGKGFYSLVDVVFEKIPDDLRDMAIKKIRDRKGLSNE
ncbi:MAG: elongation factor EF-2 [Candidatus Aenigmarchaeota archaeon]|nr:elongation factor EF-2 [Candidatus Aenigmarchaeota archaeon]